VTWTPAIAILEFDSIAHGIVAGDAMAKRAPLQVLRPGRSTPAATCCWPAGAPPRSKKRSTPAARSAGPGCSAGVAARRPPARHRRDRRRPASGGEALGMIETRTVTAVIEAADAGVKNAEVVLRELRLADELGGKGYVLFGGTVTEVESAVEHGAARIETERPARHPRRHRAPARRDGRQPACRRPLPAARAGAHQDRLRLRAGRRKR
jgi:microcompartment protein CcmL/EutN